MRFPAIHSLVAAALALLGARAVCAGAWLINAQQPDFRNRPEFIRDHFAHVETLPFDGLTISTTTGRVLMNGTPRTEAEIAADFAPLTGLAFTRMRHNFAVVNVDRPADFFGDWSVTIENFRGLAKVLKAQGIAGLFFDNEEYNGTLFNFPNDCADTSKSLAEYQRQARLRGREVMRAMSGEFPEIVCIVLHGPYSSFAGTSDAVRAGQTNWQVEELRGPFSVGLIEGMDSRSRFVDGGELYGYRTVEDFAVSYDFRKTTLASAAADCPFIPAPVRAVWPQKVSVAFGLYNLPFPAGMTMDPAIMRTTLARALERCDEYVWLYTEGLNWNAPGEVSPAWMDAVVGAKTAAESQGAAPWVSITSPASASCYLQPAALTLTASASDADGSVSLVEFFDGATKLGEVASAPFTFTWTNPAAGTHTLTARATDDSNTAATSSAVTVAIATTFAANVNFQTAGVTPPPGYFPDTGEIFGARGNGLTYGWSASHVANARFRGGSDDLRRATLCQMGAGSAWEIAVPAGSYHVAVCIGDGGYASAHTINVEGTAYWNAQPLAAGQFATQTHTVAVSDGGLTIDQGAAGDEETRIDYVVIEAAGSVPAPPSALTGKVSAAGAVELRWTDNSAGETGFKLQRSASADFAAPTQIATLAPDEADWLDSDPSAGATYHYRVQGFSLAGDSAFSNAIAIPIPLPDADGDGIPDPQEIAPWAAGVDDRLVDSDGDGASNAAEFAAGTDPLDSGSLLQVAQVTTTDAGSSGTAVTIYFPTIAGRAYFAEYTEFLGSEIWTFVPGSERDGNGSAQTISDTTASGARHYRVRVAR